VHWSVENNGFIGKGTLICDNRPGEIDMIMSLYFCGGSPEPQRHKTWLDQNCRNYFHTRQINNPVAGNKYTIVSPQGGGVQRTGWYVALGEHYVQDTHQGRSEVREYREMSRNAFCSVSARSCTQS
jgi:hypothetical protein